MASKAHVNVELKLPRETMEPLKEIAKLAGVPLASVVKVLLAARVLRWQKETEQETAV